MSGGAAGGSVAGPNDMPRFYRSVRGLARVLARVLFGWHVEGIEQLPPRGGIIVAANHLSYADPPLIGAAAPRRLRYMAKRQLFGVPGLAQLIRALGAFPIRREGMDRRALGLSAAALAAGEAVLIFPAGTRMRGGQRPVGRPGISLLAAESGVPVVPACIQGSDRLGAAIWRRRRLRVRFGAPLAPPPRGRGREHREVLREHTARIMAAIDDLAAG